MSAPRNFADEAHAQNYYVDPTDPEQRPLIGSTSVIKKAMPPYLVPWAAKLTATYAVDNRMHWQELDRAAAIDLIKKAPDRARDHAADKGTVTHRFLELHAQGQLTGDETWEAEALPYIEAGIKFLTEWQPAFIWQEATVFNPERGYAGTLDFIAELPGLGRVIGDYKTSKGVYPEVAAQLASYRYASHAVDESNQRIPIPEVAGGVVVHLKGDGTYELRPVLCDERAYQAFLDSIGICDWKSKTRGVIGTKLPAPHPSAVEPGLPGADDSASTDDPFVGLDGNPERALDEARTLARGGTPYRKDGAPNPDAYPGASDPVPDAPTGTLVERRRAWITGRVKAIIEASAATARLREMNVYSAADLLFNWWPDNAPKPVQSVTRHEQIDAIAETCSLVERDLGLAFPEPDPRQLDDGALAGREVTETITDRILSLPIDLCSLDTPSAATCTVAQAREIDAALTAAEAQHAERNARIVNLLAPVIELLDGIDLPEPLPRTIAHTVTAGRVEAPRLFTAGEVDMLEQFVDALACGYLTGNFDVSPNAAELLVAVHGNRRDALNHVKRQAKARGLPAPSSFADVLGDPILVVLATVDVETTATAAAVA